MNEPTDRQKAIRRAYGRGYWDAMRFMEGMDVNESKHKSIVSNLSGIAKKVYDAVPDGESWDAKAIIAEMQRMLGTKPDFRVVEGCLESLKVSGLLKESPPRMFVRLAIKTKEEKPDVKPEVKPVETKPVETKMDPITQLSTLAATLRERSRHVNAMLMQLDAMETELTRFADEIEKAAIAFDDQIKLAGEEAKKFRQIQQLLGGLG